MALQPRVASALLENAGHLANIHTKDRVNDTIIHWPCRMTCL